MYSEAIRVRLQHIVENSDRIANHVAGMDFEVFARHRMTIDAVERCLARISEASDRVGENDLNRIAPAAPVPVLRDVASLFPQIDAAIIWATIKDDLPALREACERALTD
jgi:uncharacterized protein with HEPN domain